MEQTVNTFNKMLLMDTNPMVQGNDSLTDCLNGTFITQNGNEIILLNDMGNARVDNAHLPLGYEPVGIKEYGGIIYVASYNPITNKSLIGSFPSPERIKGTEDPNLGGYLDFSFCDESYEGDKGIYYLKTDSKLIPLSSDTSLHVGDKFAIYYNGNDYGNSDGKFFDKVSNFNNVYEDFEHPENNKVLTPKNKLYTLSIGILNSLNEFVNITKSLLRFRTTGEYDKLDNTDSELYNFNQGYFIRGSQYNNDNINYNTQSDEEYLLNRLSDPNLNTYAYKLIGPMYLKTLLNHVLDFTYNIKGYKEDNYAYLTLAGTLTYNCPDGTGIINSNYINKNTDSIYDSYELFKSESELVDDEEVNIFNLIDVKYLNNDNDSIDNLPPNTKNNEDIPWTVVNHSYDANTNLYTLTVTREYKKEISDDEKIEIFLGIKSGIDGCDGHDLYLENLSEWITIDTNLLGSGQLKLTEYKFFNYDDYSNFQYNLEYYEKDDEIISDMYFEFYNVENSEDVIKSEIIEPVNGRGIVKIPFTDTLKLYWGRLTYKLTKENVTYNKVIYDEIEDEGFSEQSDMQVNLYPYDTTNASSINKHINLEDGTIFLLTTKLLNPCYNSSNKEEYVRNFKDFVIYSKVESENPKPKLIFKDETKYIDDPNADNSEFDRRKNAIKEKLTINYEYVTEYEGELVKVGSILKEGSLLINGFKNYESLSYDNDNVIGTDGDYYPTIKETNPFVDYSIDGSGCSSIKINNEYLIDTISEPTSDSYREIFKSEKVRFLKSDFYVLKYLIEVSNTEGLFDIAINDEHINCSCGYNLSEKWYTKNISKQITADIHKVTISVGQKANIKIKEIQFCLQDDSQQYTIYNSTDRVLLAESIPTYSSLTLEQYSNITIEQLENSDVNNNLSSLNDINNQNNSFIPTDVTNAPTELTILYNGSSLEECHAKYGKIFIQNINTKTYQTNFEGIPLYTGKLRFLLYTKRNSGNSTKNTLSVKFSILNHTYTSTHTITMYNTSRISDDTAGGNAPHNVIPVTYSIHDLKLIPGEIYDEIREDSNSDGLTFTGKLEITSSDWYIRGAVLLYRDDIEEIVPQTRETLSSYKYLPYNNVNYSLDFNNLTPEQKRQLRNTNATSGFIKDHYGYLNNKFTTFLEDEIYIIKMEPLPEAYTGCQFVSGEGLSSDIHEDGRITFRTNRVFDINKFNNALIYKQDNETVHPGKTYSGLSFNTCQEFTIADFGHQTYGISLMYTNPEFNNYNTCSTYNFKSNIDCGNSLTPQATIRIGKYFYMDARDYFEINYNSSSLFFDMHVSIGHYYNDRGYLISTTSATIKGLQFGTSYSLLDFINEAKNIQLDGESYFNPRTTDEYINLETFATYMNSNSSVILYIDRVDNIRETKNGNILSSGYNNNKYGCIKVYRRVRNLSSQLNTPRNAPLRSSSEELPDLSSILDLSELVLIATYGSDNCLDEDSDCNYYDKFTRIRTNQEQQYFFLDEAPLWFKITDISSYDLTFSTSNSYILKYKMSPSSTGTFTFYIKNNDVENNEYYHWCGPFDVEKNIGSISTPSFNYSSIQLIIKCDGENINFEELKFCQIGNNTVNDEEYLNYINSSTEEPTIEVEDTTIVVSNTTVPGQINMKYSQKFRVLDTFNSKLNVVEDYALYPDYIEESTTKGIKTTLTYNVNDYTPIYIKGLDETTYSISDKELCINNDKYITFNQIFKSKAISGNKIILNGFIRIHDAIDSVKSSDKEIANDTALGITVDSGGSKDKHYIGSVCKVRSSGVLSEMKEKHKYDEKDRDGLITFKFSDYLHLFFPDLEKDLSTTNEKQHKYLFNYCFFKAADYNGHYKPIYMANSDVEDDSLSLLYVARVWWRDANSNWVLLLTPFRGLNTILLSYHNQVPFCDYLQRSIFQTNFTYCAVQYKKCEDLNIYYPDDTDFIYTGRFNPKVSVNLTVEGGKLKHLYNNNYPPIRNNYPIKFWTEVPPNNSETLENIKEFTLEYNEDFFDEIDNVLNGGDILSIDINTGDIYDYYGEPLYPGVIYVANGDGKLVKDIDLTNKLIYSTEYKIGDYNGILCNNIEGTTPIYMYDFCGEDNNDQHTLIDYSSAKTVRL